MMQTIGTIVHDNLSAELVAYLENIDSDFNNHFCEVIDGDWSEQNDITTEQISPDDILTSDYDSHYVAADDSMSPEWVAAMDAKRERGKPYWGGQIVWCPVEK